MVIDAVDSPGRRARWGLGGPEVADCSASHRREGIMAEIWPCTDRHVVMVSIEELDEMWDVWSGMLKMMDPRTCVP